MQIKLNIQHGTVWWDMLHCILVPVVLEKQTEKAVVVMENYSCSLDRSVIKQQQIVV